MKPYAHPNQGHGPAPPETLTVGEVREILREYSAEMPFLSASEGMYGHVTSEDFKIVLDDLFLEPSLVVGG